MTTYQRISASDASALISQHDNVRVVDIRDENSYLAGHISAAQHMDNTNVQHIIQQFEFDDPIVICCYHGNSSQMAAQFIASQGFEKVYSLDGGYEAWHAQFPEHCEH